MALKWPITFTEEKIEKVAKAEDIIYLSPDAAEEISDFDPTYFNKQNLCDWRNI